MRERANRHAIVSSFFVLLGWMLLVLCPVMSVQASPRLQQPSNGDHFVIVIDPGHGGENEGTIENGFLEKQMTLKTAEAMYHALLQYDNIEVYMTRTEDVDLTLKERAEFAASVHADFLLSIHYNASVDHDLFGSEVWISHAAPYNAYGYQFGVVQLQTMQDMGLYLRGVKTRMNDRGTDYYGIIREAVALGLPAAIIEHCHVDEERDFPFCDTEEELVAFGEADALSVAKYLGLTSTQKGLDHSAEAADLADAKESVPVQGTLKDETPPEICEISLADADYDTGLVRINLTATDYDSPMLYYQYSYDGGQTFSRLEAWPESNVLTGAYKDSFSFEMQVPSGVQPYILVRVYNLFDAFTDSNFIGIPRAFHYEEEETEPENTEMIPVEEESQVHSLGTTTFMPELPEKTKEQGIGFTTFIITCLLLVFILLTAVMISQIVYNSRRRKRRRQKYLQDQRRKEEGAHNAHKR